jgi:methylated-DNA-[protein]-cysteine S-methyltransferase
MEINPNLAAWLGDSDAVPGRDPLTTTLDAVYKSPPPEGAADQAIQKVRQQFLGQAEQEVIFDSLEGTSLGTIFIAVSSDGLTALNFGVSEAHFLADVEKLTGTRPVRAPDHAREVAEQVAAYLAGERTTFDLPVDLSSLTVFQRTVLEAATAVPRGEVTTYAEIARRIGRPKAYRAVGQALGRNPVPLVIPCHRVVAADGALTGYSGGGGIETKARLLALEGARLA